MNEEQESTHQVTQQKKHAKTAVNKDGKPLRIGTGLPGPGRPKKADELLARSHAITALKKKFKTLDKAFTFLLESKEPTLIKAAFEYAFGKPVDKVDNVNGIPFNQLNIQVVASHTKDKSNESGDNNSI